MRETESAGGRGREARGVLRDEKASGGRKTFVSDGGDNFG